MVQVAGNTKPKNTILTTPHREDKKNNVSKTQFKTDFTCSIVFN